VNVIRHQAIGMHGAAVHRCELVQVGQVNEAIGIVPEAAAAIVSALHYVQRRFWDYQSRLPRHACTTTDIADR
jgi:hypothetical protein